MKELRSVLIILSIIITLVACNRSQENYALGRSAKVMEDSTILSSGNAVYDTIAPESELGERRFVRTASLKFKVDKVEDAVTRIENKSRALGGYVSFSHLENIVLDSVSISVTRDSSVQSIHYRTDGLLTLRVPDYQLDSLLKDLSQLSSVMFNREIRSEDVRIRMLANKLNQQRAGKINRRLASDIDLKGKKLSEIEEAEKTMEEKDEAADKAKLSNLTMDDAVKFSTVSVEIYQDPGIRIKEIAREKIFIEYQEPFLSQLGESCSGGWQLLEDFIISLTKYWTILVLCGIGYLVFLKYFPSDRKVKTS
jgi:Domain of unknown function (DUF4349)